MTIGDPRLPPVVLVHGSPGSIDNWVDLLTQTNVLDHAYVICVDRPGFGESNPGQHESSLALQGQAILQAVRPHLSGRRAVWLGHSFGGPVIARIAIDFPDQVSGLVFAASSVDPDLERVYWYQHLAHTRIISWMLPAVVRTTNREIYTLKPELEEMLAEWPRLQAIPTVIIHGEQDPLVPVENVDFIQRMIPSAKVYRLSNEKHFLPWKQAPLLASGIREVLGMSRGLDETDHSIR